MPQVPSTAEQRSMMRTSVSGSSESTRQRDAAPLLRIVEGLGVRESDRCREQHRNRQKAPKLHAASVCRRQ